MVGSIFFFILVSNLMGLLPGVGGATTAVNPARSWALISFVVIQVHAFAQLGIKGWSHHLLGGAPLWLSPLMIPVEIASLFIKPMALAIRLFANMVAGHTLLATLALFGLLALEGVGWWLAGGVSIVSIVFSIAITFLELFIAFLQAFIFMFLTAVFVAQMSHHHEDEILGDTEHEFGEPITGI